MCSFTAPSTSVSTGVSSAFTTDVTPGLPARSSSAAPAASAAAAVSAENLDDVIPAVTPRRTLATAVPVQSGSPFFSPVAALSNTLRNQIIAGNDVNLVKILLGSEMSDRRVVDCGDISVALKDADPRLSKTITFPEFCVAFGIYRDVMCEAYPTRRAELDTYLSIIADLAVSYGGTLFYDYHKSFSAKAATYIQRFNQKLDWSVVDLSLISRHFTGHHVLKCSICGSTAHSSALCPKAKPTNGPKAPPSRKSPQVTATGPSATPLCFNFNENNCRMYNCKYLHMCSYCGDAHPKCVCPRGTRYVKK